MQPHSHPSPPFLPQPNPYHGPAALFLLLSFPLPSSPSTFTYPAICPSHPSPLTPLLSSSPLTLFSPFSVFLTLLLTCSFFFIALLSMLALSHTQAHRDDDVLFPDVPCTHTRKNSSSLPPWSFSSSLISDCFTYSYTGSSPSAPRFLSYPSPSHPKIHANPPSLPPSLRSSLPFVAFYSYTRLINK